jgi:Ca2+-binding EF-hand superfamily protein
MTVTDSVLLQDGDNFLTPEQLDTVLRLFLPLQFGQEDVFVNNLAKKMDENSGGKIGFDAFVLGIKTSGD